MKRSKRIHLKILALFALVVLGGLQLLKFFRAPLSQTFSQSQVYYDRNGKLLRFALSDDHKYRVWTPLKELSPRLIEASLLLEDRHFRHHPGFNPVSLFRAFWKTYFSKAPRQGGSTLTMQLARLRLKGGLYTRTWSGKLHQIFEAVRLEFLYSKDEILEAYLNLVPYGGNIEGVWAASRIYFEKAPNQLSLPEAIALSVIPRNPNRHSLAELEKARQGLWKKWLHRYPDDRSLQRDFELPLTALRPRNLPFETPHLIQHLISRAAAPPGKVSLSVDLGQQETIERIVQTYLRDRKLNGIHNAAVMLLDHRTMEVRAWLGSADYTDSKIGGQVDGVRAKRSPGSSLKPFIYALAFDQGIIHPASVIKDAPASFGAYDPENFDGKFSGPISAHDALNQSRNIPAVWLTSQLKAPSLYQFLKEGQVTLLKSEDYYGLALPLGGAEVSLEELVRLYALLPGGGKFRPIQFLNSSRRPAENSSEASRLFSAEAANLTLEIMKDNPRADQNFRNAWIRDALPVYWKTGTSHGFRDAWSTGIFGNYVLGVWIGDFAGAGNPNFIGREAAGPLFFQIVDALRAQEPQLKDFQKPFSPGLRQVKVCALSGRLPGPFCQHQITTGFIPGKSPIRTCDIHRQIWVNAKTGTRACKGSTPETRPEVFEFWPSDILKLYRLAGVPRRPPPPFEQNCSLENRERGGLPPSIQTPKERLTYALRMGHAEESAIPFAATVDAGVRELFWFIDNEFIGKTSPEKTLLWQGRPGHFQVRVVDSNGRADSRELAVTLAQ